MLQSVFFCFCYHTDQVILQEWNSSLHSNLDTRKFYTANIWSYMFEVGKVYIPSQ